LSLHPDFLPFSVSFFSTFLAGLPLHPDFPQLSLCRGHDSTTLLVASLNTAYRIASI
jgi:hypothetical protein